MKQKILLLSWHPETNKIISAGGFKRAYEIAKRVPQNTDLVCLDVKPSYFEDLKDKVRLKTYSIPKLIRLITKINFILGKILEKIYVAFLLTIIIISKYRDYIIYVPFSELSQLTLPAILGKLFCRNKVVFVNLNVNHIFPENLINPIIHKFSDLNITISQDLQKDLEGNKIIATTINPVGIDVDFIEKIPEQNKEYDGIFVGRHTHEKGIFDALEICAELNKFRSFYMITIGIIPDNVKEKLKKRMNELSITDKIVMKGTVSEIEKIQYYKKSRVCIFSSYQEGWGIVPQEAIISNIPVVAYDLDVYKENIISCKAVWRVNIGAIIEFKDKVSEILDMDKVDLEKYINQSKQIINKYSWDSVAQNEFKIITNQLVV